MFLDEVEVEVVGGNGGNGAIAFRREKFVPRGGPNGGTGGDGGNVILYVDPGQNTLSAFRYQHRFVADRGGHGGGSERQGARGDSLRIPVPPGTVVREAESSAIVADLVDAGQEAVVARGGRGGRGNAAFKKPTRQTPRFAEKGSPGESHRLVLELKLIADVGIIGVPNAGKSTFLSVISAARPKIADYPFTTLSPNLGVAQLGDRTIVFADIPGLIEGASEGAGLGHQFLRHIERTKVLVHMIDGASEDPVDDLKTVNAELAAFSAALGVRPQVVAVNKVDLPFVRTKLRELEAGIADETDAEVLALSAATGEGVKELVAHVTAMVDELPEAAATVEGLPVLRPLAGDEDAFDVFRVVGEEAFRIKGARVERAAAITDFQNSQALARFQRILDAVGVTDRLRELGIAEGATVRIGSVEFEWEE